MESNATGQSLSTFKFYFTFVQIIQFNNIQYCFTTALFGRLVFFLASPDEETAFMAKEVLQRYPGAEVVNLANEWPNMLRDREATLAAHGRKRIPSRSFFLFWMLESICFY